MLKTAPDPQDVQDIQFKLHCKLKIFSNKSIEPFSKKCSLLASASQYGLIFVGVSQSLHVIRCDDLEQCSVKDGEKADYLRRIVDLNGRVTHLSVNCDNTVLAVVTEVDNLPVAHFYDIKSFFLPQIMITNRLQISASPGTTVLDIGWNPAIPELFSVCKSDGSFGVYGIRKDVTIHELPRNSAATCFCWSPKGKLVAVGLGDRIVQHRPDLTQTRIIGPPPIEGQKTIVSLQWVSSFQFIAVYTITNGEDVSNNVMVVDTPKSGELSYTNYYDICYSNLPARPTQFYMTFISQWNMLVVASSNSMEVGVLYLDKDTWKQLTLMDSARAELPLSSDHSDTLPIGFALDTSATQPLPWGEGSIPPAPRLFLLSHYGVLCCFNVVNLKNDVPSVCTPPQKINGMALTLFTKGHSESVIANKNVDTVEKPKEALQPHILKVPEAKMEQPVPVSAPLFTNQQSTPFSSVSAKSSLSQEQKFSFANIHPADPNQNSSALPKMNTLSFDAHLMKQTSISSEIPKIVDSPVTSLPQVPKPQAIFPQKPETESAVQSEVQDNSNLEDKELMDLLTRMIKEECVAIESELNALLHQARLLDVSIGTDNEKNMLAIATTQLQEFLLEVVNNNTVQKSDVHLLKQNLIQTWAWLEEARSRYNASNDSTIAAILRAQPLDSAAEKQLLHIKHLMYYLESQLKQAHGALDEQWENFQDYCRKTYRTQLPTMEAIFQSMVKHNAILQKLTYNLKDISARINAHIQSKTKLSPLLVLDNLKKVEEDLKNLTIGPQDVFRMHYERILARNKLMSPNKTCKLRNYLNQTDVKHISSFHATIPKPPQLQAVKQIGGQKSPSLSTAQTDKAPQVKPGAPSFLFQSDKSKESPQLLSLSKSHSFASAFVPTSNSTGLFDNASTAFKAVPLSLAPGKSGEISNTSVVTPLTTASLFSNAPTKSLINKSVSASQIQAFNNPAAFSFAALKPSEAQPLKFDYQKPNITESSVIIIETSNLQNTSTPKTFNFKLPTNEVSIIKTQASGSTFSVSKDTASVQSAASVATVPTSTKVSVGKTCSTSFTSSTNPVPTNLTFGALNMTTKKEDQRPQTVKEISVVSPSVSSVSLTNPPSLAHQLQIPPSSAPTKSSGESDNSLFKPSAQVKENLFGSGKSTNETVTTQNTEQTSHAKAFQNLSNLFAGSGISVSPVFNTTAISTPGIDSKSSSHMKSLFNITTTDGEVKSTDTATTSVATKSVFGVSSPSAFQSSLLGNSGSSKLLFGTTNYPTATTATITTATPVTVVASVTSSTTTNTTPIEDVKSGSINASTPVQVGNVFGSLSSSLAKASDASLKVTNATISTVASTTVTSSQDMNAKGTTSLAVSQSNIFGSSIKMPDASISTTSNQTISTISTATVTTSFNQKTTAPTTQSSIFGGVQSAATNNVESPIGSPGSIFSGTPSATTSKSIFGNLGNTSVSTSSVSTVTTSSVSAFFGPSTVSSTSSVFATPTTPSTTVSFSSVTTAGALFGNSSLSTPFEASTAPESSSLFGSTATTTASPFSSSVVSTTPGIFGSTVSTNPSVFGTASSAKPSLFGSPAPTGSSLFSSATTSATSSIFGSVASTAPSSPFTSSAVSVAPTAFGSSPISTANVQFGSSTSSVFGNTPATSAPFGSAVTSSAPSVFGAAAGKSIFGNTSTAFAPTGSIFGTPNSSAAAASGANTFGTQPSGFNTFGSANTTNFQQPSPFGSIFGTPASSAANTPVSSSAGIGTTSSFGNLTPQFGTSSSGSLFGTPAASTSNASFGFGGLNVSSTTASSQFGTNANPFAKASSIFGTPSTQSSSTFGGSVFGSASQNTFGSQQPTFGSASVFGQQSTFGQNAFGSSQPGPFSGGNSTVSQSGFGTPPAFQKPSGFGSPPVFGSSPSFGSAPSFGGAPAFGSSPTFGSPGKIFGGGSLSGSFQSTTQENSTFANLANQNTVGFGSLAQQAQNSSSSPFSANSSFSSWR